MYLPVIPTRTPTLMAKGIIIGIRSFIMGAIIASILLSLRIKDRKDKIAFGPYICIGMFISLLYGQQLLNIYLGLF